MSSKLAARYSLAFDLDQFRTLKAYTEVGGKTRSLGVGRIRSIPLRCP